MNTPALLVDAVIVALVIAVVAGGWTWGCRQAGDVEPKHTPAISRYEKCATPTRAARRRTAA